MSDAGEVIYLPDILVTPEPEPVREGFDYSPGGGKAEPAPSTTPQPLVKQPAPSTVRVPVETPSYTTMTEPEYQVTQALPKSVPYKPPPEPEPESPKAKAAPKSGELPPSVPYAEPPTPEQSRAKSALQPVGVALNTAAGAVEGAVPGLAHAAASPLDMPINWVRNTAENIIAMPGEVQALARRVGSLVGWATPETEEETTSRKAGVQAALPFLFPKEIPASPGGSYLTKKAGDIGIPTPENPIQSIPARTDAEVMARRAGQVGSQVLTSTLGAKPFGRYPEAGAPPTITAGVLAGPRAMGAAPPISTGLVAGGADVVGQLASEQARKAGFSPETARQAEIGAGLVSALPIGLGLAGAKAPFVKPALEIGASGRLGAGVQERARDKLAAREARRAGPSALAQAADWEPSTANVGDTLLGQATAEQQQAVAGIRARQAQADHALARIGGTADDLYGRLEPQLNTMKSELATMEADVPSIGKQIRAGINKLARKDGLFGRLAAEDPKNKGKPLVPDSKVPGMVFNSKVTYEDLAAMFNRATKAFREGYQAIGLDDFIRKTQKLGSDGKPTGQIDLAEAAKWLADNKALLDNVEDQMLKQWGPKALEDHGIRARVGAAIERQKGIDDLNAQRDGLLRSVGEGGKDKAIVTSVWKPGASGGAAVKSYLDMAKGAPDAMNNLVDIAAASLRNFATKGGEFKAALAERWISTHKDAIDQLPADIRSRFTNAQSAQGIVDEYTAIRAQAINEFRTGAAKGMLEGKDPAVAIGEIFNNREVRPEIGIREISARLRSDPAAHDGLKRDFMKYAVGEAARKTAAEARPETWVRNAPSARDTLNKNMENLNNFLKENQASVRELFGDTATDHMLAMLRNKPRIGSPGSVGWLLGGLVASGGAAMTDMTAYSIWHFAQAHPGVTIALSTAGLTKHVVDKLRGVGVKNVNDFLADAMSNPELMRDLSKSASDQVAWKRVMRQLGVIGTEESMGGYGTAGKSSAPALPPT